MGATIVSYTYVGFRVEEHDFWVEVPAKVATCGYGHEHKGEGPFCPLDGTRFERRSIREASKKFKALVEHFGWSIERGYERLFDDLRENEDEDSRDIGIYDVSASKPTREGPGHLAVARVLSRISGWDRTKYDLVTWDAASLQKDFDIFEKARVAVGFHEPVQLFSSLYVG